MKLNIKNIFIILLGVLGFAGAVYAAPTQTFLRNALPEANNTYDLGSTTPNLRWKNVYTTNLDVSGTCNGCGGGGSLSGGTPNALMYWVNSTTAGATTTQPLTVGTLNATSTTGTSYFGGNVNLPSLTATTILTTDGTKNITSSSSPTANNYYASLSTATSTFVGGANFAVLGGNVGIGTSTPSATLSITDVGNTFPTNSTTAGQMSTRIQINNRATVVGAGAGLSFAGFSTTGNGIYASIDAPVTSNSASVGSGGNLYFSLKSSAAATSLTTLLALLGSQLVGISTTSPTVALTVDSSTNASVWIDPNTTYNGVAFGGKRGAGGWSGGYQLVGNSAGGNVNLGGFMGVGGTGLTRFVIGTPTTNELMSILASGNVGIGTTTPAQKLEVYKSSGDLYSRLDANQSTADVALILNNSGSNANSWAVKRNNTSGTLSINRSSATFPTTGTITQPFTINTTDNVGIGTTTMFSQNELTIANGSGPQISLTDGSATTNQWNFRVMPSGDLAFATSSAVTGATTTPNAILFSATGVGLSVGATSTNPIAYATFETANNPRNYQFYVASSTRVSLTVDNAGSVTLPSINGGAGTAYVCMTLASYALSTSTTACNPSSAKLKDNIKDFESNKGIEDVLKLRPVTFTYKPNMKISGNQVGFIAEEVYKVVPEAVGLDSKGQPYNVDYSKIVPSLTKAIQDIWHKLTGYDQRIAKLEKENSELKARLDKLEKKIDGK